MRKITLRLLSLTLLAPAVVYAQSSGSTSLDQLTTAANNGTDKSMQLLQQVFGSIVTNPLGGSSSSSSSSTSGMIAQILTPINTIILTLATLWAGYIFVSGLIATGAEGEFMGAKRSSIWFTIRTAIGLSMAVPIAGYSLAQLIMLWATVGGIGLANLTTSAATSVLTSGGSMVASPTAPAVTSLAQSLFEANLCASATKLALDAVPTESFVGGVDQGEYFTAQTSSGMVALTNQNGESCGGAQVQVASSTSPSNSGNSTTSFTSVAPDTSSITSALSSAQQSALTTMQTTLSAAAATYASAVQADTPAPDPQATINQAAQAYQSSIQSAIQSAGSSVSSMSSTLATSLQQDGWITMGSWYQSFAIANSQLSNSAQATATAIPPTDLSGLPYPQLYSHVMAVYHRQLQLDASTSMPAVGSATSTTGVAPGSGTSSLSNLFSVSTDPEHLLAAIFPGQNLVNAVTSTMSGSGTGQVNPLIGMKNVGDYILDAGWGALGLYVSGLAAEGASENGAGFLAKEAGNILTGGAVGSVIGALSKILTALGPMITMMVVSLFFFGAMLSVYLPMLPFIVWFGGIVSWFAVVCEGLIAAPLWAMMHVAGEGEGMGPRTNHGYVFLMNLILRPAIMVIGFVLASAGVNVFGTLLNSMFSTAMANAQYESVTGIVSIIAYIVLYVGMCQSLCQVLFGMVTHLPNVVFAWAGEAISSHLGDGVHDKSHAMIGAAVGHGRSAATPLARDKGQPKGAPPAGIPRPPED